MAGKLSLKAKRSGFTLITALAFTLVVGTVLAGVGSVALSHLGRSKVEGTYANAITLADAGINYEILRISANPIDPNLPDQWNSPRTVLASTLPGMSTVDGQFQVHVRVWGSNCDGSTTWASPKDLCIESTGTVHGVSRTIVARGSRKSVFDEYAIYAYDVSFVNGTGASNKTGIDGNMGANGTTDFKGNLGTGAVHGLLSLNGPNAGLGNANQNAGNTQSNPDPVIFPTVSQVADQLFGANGLAWLQTHNNNANIKMLLAGDPTLASEPTIANLTLNDVNTKMTSAGFTTASRSMGTAPITATKDTSTLDKATTGTRFMMVADAVHGAQSIGANTGGPTYFLPPGDYYFNDLDLQKNASWVMLTHLGAIRVWVDGNGTGDDISKLNVIFSDPTKPGNFRLFYNKCGQLKMNGQGIFSGSIYAIKNGCSDGPGIDLEGGNVIFGSVIVNDFRLGGSSWVVFPNNGGNDNSNDPSLWYGFKDHWQEVKTIKDVSHTVFADGTAD